MQLISMKYVQFTFGSAKEFFKKFSLNIELLGTFQRKIFYVRVHNEITYKYRLVKKLRMFDYNFFYNFFVIRTSVYRKHARTGFEIVENRLFTHTPSNFAPNICFESNRKDF